MSTADPAMQGGVAAAIQDELLDFFSATPTPQILPGEGLLKVPAPDEATADPLLKPYLQRTNSIRSELQRTLKDADDTLEYLTAQQKEAVLRDKQFRATINEPWIEDKAAILPIGGSNLRMDEQRLNNSALLATRSMLDASESLLASRTIAFGNELSDVTPDPHYVQTTMSFQNRTAHSKALFAKHKDKTGSPEGSPKKVQVELSAAEKRRRLENAGGGDGEKIDIPSVLFRFFVFMPNPRNKPLIPRDPSKSRSKVPVPPAAFRSLPPIARFTKYEVGVTVKTEIRLQNCTGILQRLRVVPPASIYFSVGALQLPTVESSVAPGMDAKIVVSFCADNLSSFEDVLVVQTELGNLSIPLVAQREAPKLSLPAVLECGDTWVNKSLPRRFTVKNSGGDARFVIISGSEWPNPDEDAAHSRASVSNGAFTIFPAQLDLPSGSSVELNVTFDPTCAGLSLEEFKLVCDNLTVISFAVEAAAHVQQLTCCDVDSNVAAGASIAASSADSPVPLPFAFVSPGSETVQVLTIKNPYPLPISFAWALQLLGGELVSPFSIFPEHGCIAGGATEVIKLIFRPTSTRRLTAAVSLNLVDYPQPGGVSKSHEQLQFQLVGEGQLALVSLSPGIVYLAGDIVLGKNAFSSFEIVSQADAPVAIEWETLPDVVHQTVSIQPPSAVLPPKSRCSADIRIDPSAVGKFHVNLRCKVSNGPPLLLHVIGNVVGPQVSFKSRDVNFGMVRASCIVKQHVQIVNSSEVSAIYKLTPTGPNASYWKVTPSSGRLEARGSLDLTLSLSAANDLTVHGWLQMDIENGASSWISVRAQVLRPAASLVVPKIDLGTLFTRVPVSRTMQLCNLTKLPTAFRFEKTPLLSNGVEPALDISMAGASGVLQPLETRTVDVTVTAKEGCPDGPLEFMLGCDVQGAAAPVVASLTAIARGLVVSYHMGFGADLPPSKVIPALPKHVADISLKIATTVGKVASATFCVRNHSGISAAFDIHVVRNPAPIETDSSLLEKQVSFHGSITSGASISQSTLALAQTLNMGPEAGRTQARADIAVATGVAAGTFTRTQREIRRSRAQAPFVTRGFAGLEMAMRPKHDDITGNRDFGGLISRGTLPRPDTFSGLRTMSSLKRSDTPLLEDESVQGGTYRSVHGQKHMATKQRNAEAGVMLCDGRGVALTCSTYGGVLEPWATEDITVTLYSNACGSFGDAIAVSVQGLITTYVPCQVDIEGTPVFVEGGTLGLSLNSDRQQPHTIDFGAVLRSSASVNRCVRVLNGSPYDVRFRWNLHERATPAVSGWVQMTTSVNDDGQVVYGAAASEAPLDETGVPFTLVERDVVVSSMQSHVQTVVCAGDEAGLQKRFLNLTLEYVSSTDDGWEGNRTAKTLPGEVAELLWRKVAPLDVLGAYVHVSLQGCALETDCMGHVRWRCSAVDDATQHPSFVRTITLSNPMRATVHFDVKLEGKEFSIDAIDGQALPLVTDLGAKQATAAFKYHLNPADNISVRLRFTPSARHRNGKIVEDIKPAGGISISFSNGDSQELGLEAVLHHPEVQLSAPASGLLDFGTLHVECERTLLCTVTNVSHCDAAVSFSHVKKAFQASVLSKADDEEEAEASSEVGHALQPPCRAASLVSLLILTQAKVIDDPNCFTFEPKEAVLRGRRWQAVVPSQLVFKVTMRPSAPGAFLRCSSRLAPAYFIAHNFHVVVSQPIQSARCEWPRLRSVRQRLCVTGGAVRPLVMMPHACCM